jgi:hypothetical protein
MAHAKKIEFGDFQTPLDLTENISKFIQTIFREPVVVVEPTCGFGGFIESSVSRWGEASEYYGFDLNRQYIEKCKNTIDKCKKCNFEVADFFQKDWREFFATFKKSKILVIGNPPWVTNAAIGTLNGTNLPQKSNFQGLDGFAAKTGKANFDIAEWMLIKLLESLQNTTSCLAMLCKTSTARKVLKHSWKNQWNVSNTSLHLIDAKLHFDVSVDACLFVTFIIPNEKSTDAAIYKDFSYDKKICHFGLSGDELVSNIDDYNRYNFVEGLSYYTWRSGIKHDSSKVMELSYNKGRLVNGLGETITIEDDYIYPLLKSSDLGNKRLVPRKFVIVTQQNVGDDTSLIQRKTPKTWKYLENHSDFLDTRKSIIYKNRPRFSIFGIGNYSFSPWKVAISGLYKTISFSSIGNIDGKSIMVDDTCYFIPCETKKEADLIADLLNSKPCTNFIKSLVFFDAKRPVNIDILKRIDIKKIADSVDKTEEVMEFLPYAQQFMTPQQLLVFEKEIEYRSRRCT